MNMSHEDYLQLREQLQNEFDGRYVKAEDCIANRNTDEGKFNGLKEEFSRFREEERVDRAKTTTRLNILIGILVAIATPILGVAVKLFFG